MTRASLSNDACWELFRLCTRPGVPQRHAAIRQRLQTMLDDKSLPQSFTWHKVRLSLTGSPVEHHTDDADLLGNVLDALAKDLEPSSTRSELLRLPADLLGNILQRISPASCLQISRCTCMMTFSFVTSVTLTPAYHHLLQYMRALTALELHFSPYHTTSTHLRNPQDWVLEHMSRACTSLQSLAIKGAVELRSENVAQIAELTSLQALSLANASIPASCLSLLSTLSRLSSLDMSSTPLDDAALAAFPELPALSVLSLRSCSVSGSGVKHLSRLALRDLDLQGTRVVDDADYACLAELPMLTRVALTTDGVWGDGMQAVLQLPSLHTLELVPKAAARGRSSNCWPMDAYPELHVDALERLAAVSSLRSLDISAFWANLERTTTGVISRLSHLQSLGIMLRFDVPLFSEFSQLTSLTALNVHAVYGTMQRHAFSLEALANLPKLQRLTLRGIKSGIEVDCLHSMPALQHLALVDVVHLSDPGLAVIRDLVQALGLRGLSLAGCEGVGDMGLHFLSGLTTLTSLDLSRTFIRGPGLKHLVGLTGLRELRLSQNAIMAAALKHLEPLRRSATVVLDRPAAGRPQSPSGDNPLPRIRRLHGQAAAAASVTTASLKSLQLWGPETSFRRAPSRNLAFASLL